VVGAPLHPEHFLSAHHWWQLGCRTSAKATATHLWNCSNNNLKEKWQGVQYQSTSVLCLFSQSSKTEHPRPIIQWSHKAIVVALSHNVIWKKCITPTDSLSDPSTCNLRVTMFLQDDYQREGNKVPTVKPLKRNSSLVLCQNDSTSVNLKTPPMSPYLIWSFHMMVWMLWLDRQNLM
jgi:hypothetical protein